MEIAVDLGGDTASIATIAAVTSKIFLDARDSLADLVPDYWKSCIQSGLSDKSKNCQFSPDLLSIPGVIRSDEIQPALPLMNRRSLVPTQLFRVGNGVSLQGRPINVNRSLAKPLGV